MNQPSTPRLPALLPLLPICVALAAVLPVHAADSGHAAPAKAAKPAAMTPPAKAVPQAAADPLDTLRDRLAERLGARAAPEAGSNTVRVVAKPAAAAAASPAKAGHSGAKKPGGQAPAHWGYAGEAGPAAWGGLRPDFSLCAKGQRQSPIDIRDGIAVDLEPVQFDYKASGFGVIDNGHTVQVNVAPGNVIHVGGRRWELQQFHFHRPSEERIDGRQFDMVAHLVHKDADGRLAVVAVLLDKGSIQPIVQMVWNNLPLEKGEEFKPQSVIDLTHLLPPDRRYYTYMGSLTTPPCSEGVLWMVMRQPVQVSQQQIDIFSRLYPMNARPVQQASGRLIKQSQ
ncbi:carbonic anhydrase [Rubrivivax sp. RP6-9]|uniref:carbonic anhydrase n=1 Tax=Rubrivivax sp. RP6-9 TaxID=3415750 RepID=UPI003CC64E91